MGFHSNLLEGIVYFISFIFNGVIFKVEVAIRFATQDVKLCAHATLSLAFASLGACLNVITAASTTDCSFLFSNYTHTRKTCRSRKYEEEGSFLISAAMKLQPNNLTKTMMQQTKAKQTTPTTMPNPTSPNLQLPTMA